MIESFIIDKHLIKRYKYIAEGAYGKVYKGFARRDYFNNDYERIAVKDISLYHFSNDEIKKIIRDFNHELEVMEFCDSPFLIKFFGYTIQEDMLSLLMELCSGGGLNKYFKNNSSDLQSYSLNEQQKIKILTDIAKGLQVLHQSNPPIIHRDIKSMNILLKEAIVDEHSEVLAKIADFGISDFLYLPKSSNEINNKIAGTVQWMAPELFNSEFPSFKSDIYAFGVLMWEVFSEQIPYADSYDEDGYKLSLDQISIKVILEDIRPHMEAILPDTKEEIKELMKKCWATDKDARPELNEVIETLEALLLKN